MTLRDHPWQPTYSHEDGDLVDLFFLPALACAKQYQRVTGYFNEGALALATRGLESIVQNAGYMQLIVGCTLEQDEIDAIESGYAIRTLIGKGLSRRLFQESENEWQRERLGWLAWMIANQYLDVKVAIPKDATGHFRAGLGLFHAKSGLLIDGQGDKLVFRGSINETYAGWKQNCESFDVSCSWRGEHDLGRVIHTENEFAKLWSNTARSAEVIDVPDAVKHELLRFMPADDSFIRPSNSPNTVAMPTPPEELEAIEEGHNLAEAENVEVDAAPAPDDVLDDSDSVIPMQDQATLMYEQRRKLWAYIRDAAKFEDGAMVSVKTATVDPWPHQLRAYRRMLDHWPFRMLIADEVGLGKTIEAGLIIRHAWISGMAKRILILTPSALQQQWQAELYEKFNLIVPIYTGQAYRYPDHHFSKTPKEAPVARETWTQAPLLIASSHLMRRRDRQGELRDAEDWDLLVLDEAHHARRRGAGGAQSKGVNHLLRLLLDIRDKADSLLLMTATPMQVAPVEIWDLMQVLGLPDEWNETTFLRYFQLLDANPSNDDLHWLAQLFQATERYYGELQPDDVASIIAKWELSPVGQEKIFRALRDSRSKIRIRRLESRQRDAALEILRAASPVRFLMSRHTRPLLREYVKKGYLDSIIANRIVKDFHIELSANERELYEAVEEYISNTFSRASSENRSAVGFVMTVYRRRVASSFYALRKTLERKLALLEGMTSVSGDNSQLEEDVSQNELLDDVVSSEEVAAKEQEALAVEQSDAIKALLKSIARLGTDSKALRLIEELKNLLQHDYDGAIVFTQYTDTMDFLKDFVADRIDLPIGCFSGQGGQRRSASGHWSTCSKEDIKRLLRTGEIKVLICNDAAGEGLNLQTCGVLVNYDLPWNPMKVEQRIGRIDRIGQVYPEVQIINLSYADTVESDVYSALQQRIGFFTGVVGKLQPILSQLPKAFENATLAKTGQREQARHDVLTEVNQLVDMAEKSGFDIDEVSESDMQPPDFMDTSFDITLLNTLLRTPELLPPTVKCHELESSTYALHMPGETTPARVTTDPAIFDEHFESHQLLVHDSPLFRAMLEANELDDIPEKSVSSKDVLATLNPSEVSDER